MAVLVCAPVMAQNTEKKAIDNEAYDLWHTIKQTQWSEDGRILSYQISPKKGDAWLYFLNSETLKKIPF